MSDTMKTIEISEPGGPEVLVLGERAVPQAGPGEILVKVMAAGVNGPDRLQRRGLYQPPPGASDLLGLEVSGEVVGVGEGVTRWQVGDVICALTNGGGYAEYVAINAEHCMPIPDGVDPVDAAGLPETYFTVWSNLFLDHPVPSDEILLIHGGSGGIGTTAIQLGKLMGMQVFATCSTKEKEDFCRDLGADQTINYLEQDFVDVMKEAGGAAIIVDIMGGDYIARNLKAVKHDGRIVQLAFNAGSRVEIDLMPVMLKRLAFTGSTLRARSPEFKARLARSVEKNIWPHFADGKLKTLTHSVFSFEDVVAAHTMMENSEHRGKILIQP